MFGKIPRPLQPLIDSLLLLFHVEVSLSTVSHCGAADPRLGDDVPLTPKVRGGRDTYYVESLIILAWIQLAYYYILTLYVQNQFEGYRS